MEVLKSVNSDNETKKEIEEKVRLFLSEESIQARTKNCKSYFQNFIPTQVNLDNDVSPF